MSDNSQVTELIDKFGRRVDYIRLSVTDRCDFRCVYCMTEDMTFLPRDQILSLEELYRVAKVFTELGVKKIRLTGGEPLVRSDVMSLIEKLGALEGLEELLLTTNGAQLEKFAIPLKAAGVNRINISIDSLDAERFKRISRVGKLDKVLAGIDAANAAEVLELIIELNKNKTTALLIVTHDLSIANKMARTLTLFNSEIHET